MPTVETDDRTAVVDITDRVRREVPPETEGVATVFSRHTTAGVVLQEAEGRLLADIETVLSDLVPDGGWRHDEIDDNADSHLRTMLLGNAVTVPVSDGDLDLGTWQAVLLVECDGPRTRQVDVVVH